MAKYSRGYEQEELDKMGRGCWHSVFGLLFCWVPGLGLILSMSGFVRQVVRITEKHRIRHAVLLCFSVLSLMSCVAVLFVGIYQYSRNPDLPHELLTSAWQRVTGEEALPWESGDYDDGGDGTDYTDSANPGLGALDGYDPNALDGGMGAYTGDETDGVITPESDENVPVDKDDAEGTDTLPPPAMDEGI